MPNFTIANKIELANPHANLDVLYGPYNSLAEAKATVLSVLREKGLTVGVYESSAVVEYWWKAGTADGDLVLKQASVAGAMLESDYTGETGTKQVNYAKSADEAEQAIHSYSANQDALGREIHTTYALKQSGVTPPKTARVILDDDTPTYTIVALTAENLIVENNATTSGEIIAPVLAADKTLKISIIGNDTLLNGTSYADGVTIFAIYEASTETWTFNSILDPEVPDYSDMTVDVMVDNPTITPKTGYIRITGEVWILGTMVFLRTTDTPTPIGIYRCVGAGAGYSNLKLIAAGTALHTVRVKDGDVWYSQYDGKNAGTQIFKSGALWTREIIPLVCSDEISDITASTTLPKLRFVFPASFSLISIFAEMNVAPVGGTFTIDIKKNGTSVFSTLITFDSGETSTRTASIPYVLTAPLSFVLGDYIEVFVTLAGTVTAGKGLKLYLLTNKIA